MLGIYWEIPQLVKFVRRKHLPIELRSSIYVWFPCLFWLNKNEQDNQVFTILTHIYLQHFLHWLPPYIHQPWPKFEIHEISVWGNPALENIPPLWKSEAINWYQNLSLLISFMTAQNADQVPHPPQPRPHWPQHGQPQRGPCLWDQGGLSPHQLRVSVCPPHIQRCQGEICHTQLRFERHYSVYKLVLNM